MELFDNLATELKNALRNISIEDLKNAMPDVSPERLQELAGMLKDRAGNIRAEDINNLFEEAKKSCADNPIRAAILVLQLLLLVCPAFMTVPFLAVLGFTGIGPLAGSVAAAFQSIHGVNFIYSMLQSAAMSGYGAPVLAGIVRGTSAAGAVGSFAYGFWRNWTQATSDPKL